MFAPQVTPGVTESSITVVSVSPFLSQACTDGESRTQRGSDPDSPRCTDGETEAGRGRAVAPASSTANPRPPLAPPPCSFSSLLSPRPEELPNASLSSPFRLHRALRVSVSRALFCCEGSFPAPAGHADLSLAPQDRARPGTRSLGRRRQGRNRSVLITLVTECVRPVLAGTPPLACSLAHSAEGLLTRGQLTNAK